ncbi:MAG: hypothetical protein LBI17_01550 [Rickettsiales bacterium]|jgi:hypothetical protein|nr:hypothetical protein [Rickettsiales bacterium]
MVHRGGGVAGGTGGEAEPADAGASGMPVYPFTVDVPSMPERRYMAGIYSLAKAGLVSMLVSIALCALLVLRALSISTSPKFIYWNALDSRFELMPEGRGPSRHARYMAEDEYLTEYFAREYVTRTFSISTTLADNEREWCDCAGAANANAGLFDPRAECFVCVFSIPRVYSSFAADQKPAFGRLAMGGVSRAARISDVERIRRGSLVQTRSIFDMALGLFVGGRRTTPVYTEYRIDFILEDRVDGTLRREAMTAYLTVLTERENRNSYAVVAASYMFPPNGQAMIRNWLERQAGGEE